MPYLALYSRALVLLKPEKKLALMLAGAAFLLGLFCLAQVLLFGWIVQALTQSQPVLTLVLILAGCALGALALQLWLAQQAERMAHRRRIGAMAQFFTHVLATNTQPVARASEILRRGSDQLFLLLLTFFRDHLASMFVFLLALPLAFWMSGIMALTLTGAVALFAFLNAYLTKQAFSKQDEIEKFHAHVAARAANVMDNANLVQAYTRIEAETRGLNETMQNLLRQQYPVLEHWARRSIVFNAVLAGVLVTLLGFGGFLYSETQLGLFELLCLVALAPVLLARAEGLTDFANTVLLRTKTLHDFFTLLDHDAIVREAPDAAMLILRTGGIEFRDVNAHGLKNFSFSIMPGEKVAVVDADGMGAAVLSALLLRTLDPSAGQILIDNQNIAHVTLASLRETIGLVTPALLERTIMENLTLGKPEATQDDIIAAVMSARAHDFIGEKPDGFHTMVGEATLSPSERERLSIARVLLKNAGIVLFTEARNDQDEDVQAALDQLLSDRTALFFPHRLSTLQKADRILVLENGGIAESGAYDTLTQSGGRLAGLISEGRFSAHVTHVPAQQKRPTRKTG